MISRHYEFVFSYLFFNHFLSFGYFFTTESKLLLFQASNLQQRETFFLPTSWGPSITHSTIPDLQVPHQGPKTLKKTPSNHHYPSIFICLELCRFELETSNKDQFCVKKPCEVQSTLSQPTLICRAPIRFQKQRKRPPEFAISLTAFFYCHSVKTESKIFSFWASNHTQR